MQVSLDRWFNAGLRVLILCLACGAPTLGAANPAVPLDPPKDPPPPRLEAGYDNGFFIRSDDEAFLLRINGRLQPRYEYERRGDAADTSSFYMRRVRVDLRGHVIAPDLTFRIMPELARDANLRDGWINYAFEPSLQLRAGQFTVPFQWHRAVSGMRQHFVERGLPSREFGFPSGYDIGLMLHGRDHTDRWAYGVGVFDGAGRNVKESNSNGHMASARLAFAPLGVLPREEPDYAHSAAAQWAVGVGAQAANKSEVREWDLGRTPEDERDSRAHWTALTADTRWARRGLSLALEGYLRHVSPRADTVDSYDGWAFMASSGYFVLPQRLELVGRYSLQRLDRREADTESREWGAGVNLHFHGHNAKLRVQYLDRDEFDDGRRQLFIVEQHISF